MHQPRAIVLEYHRRGPNRSMTSQDKARASHCFSDALTLNTKRRLFTILSLSAPKEDLKKTGLRPVSLTFDGAAFSSYLLFRIIEHTGVSFPAQLS